MTIPISERTNWSFSESVHHPLASVRNVSCKWALEFFKKSVGNLEKYKGYINSESDGSLQNVDFL